MAGPGILLDLLTGISKGADELAIAAKLSDTGKLLLTEFLDDLPKSDTPLRDYKKWITNQVDEGHIDDFAATALRNSGSFKEIARAESTIKGFSQLQGALENGGKVHSTENIRNGILLTAQRSGATYNVDQVKAIDDGIAELKKLHGIDTPEEVATHIGTGATPGAATPTPNPTATGTTPPGGTAAGTTPPPVTPGAGTGTASANVIPKANKNFMQHLGRFHFTNWGIPGTNINYATATKVLPIVHEISNVAKTMPNMFIKQKFVRPIVESVDASIKASGVIDAAIAMEKSIVDVGARLSSGDLTKAAARTEVETLFKTFADDNVDNLAKLQTDLEIRIKELKARVLVADTPRRGSAGIEDLSKRQKDTGLKYLEDIRSMASNLARPDAAAGNSYADDFLKRIDGAATDFEASDMLKYGGLDRFSRLGSNVQARLDPLGTHMYEDVAQLERSIHASSYQRNTRFTHAAKDVGNNAEVDFGKIITFFKDKLRETGRVKWTDEEAEAISGHIETIYDAGYPEAAARAIEVTYSFMGRAGDDTIPTSITGAFAKKELAASAAGDAHKLEFYKDLRQTINDKPHSNTEYGPRAMWAKTAELESFFTYGTYFSEPAKRKLFGQFSVPDKMANLPGVRNLMLDAPGLPYRSIRDTYARNAMTKVRAYLLGTDTVIDDAATSQKANSSGIGTIPRLKVNPEGRSMFGGVKNIARDAVINPLRTTFSGGLLGRTGRLGLGSSENTWSLSRHARAATIISGTIAGVGYGGVSLYEKLTGHEIENNTWKNALGFTFGAPDLIGTYGTKGLDLLLPGSPLNWAYEGAIGKHIGFDSYFNDPESEESKQAAAAEALKAEEEAKKLTDAEALRVAEEAKKALEADKIAATTTKTAAETARAEADAAQELARNADPATKADLEAKAADAEAKAVAAEAAAKTAQEKVTKAADDAKAAEEAKAAQEKLDADAAAKAAADAAKGNGTTPATPADAESVAAMANYRLANASAALIIKLENNPGSDSEEKITTGAVQNVAVMAQQLETLDQVSAKLRAEGKTDEADTLIRLRSVIDDNNIQAQSINNTMQTALNDTIRISDEVQKLRKELEGLNADSKNDARQVAIGAQLQAYATELKPHEETMRTKLAEIANLRAANADYLGRNSVFSHYSGWRGDVNEGLIKAGGGKYGLLNQMLGTDGPDMISVVEGYGQAGIGYIKGIGEWWQRKKDNTRSQSERNWLNGIETGATVLGGLVALNMIDKITGNKMPRWVKWGLFAAVAMYALNRSGKIGNNMANNAQNRKTFRFPASQTSSSANGSRTSSSSSSSSSSSTGRNTPNSLTGNALTNPDGSPINPAGAKDKDMVSSDTRTAAEREAAGECILKAEPCATNATKLTPEQIGAVNKSGQGSTEQTITQDHRGGMIKTPNDITVSGIAGVSAQKSGTTNLPTEIMGDLEKADPANTVSITE